MLPWVQSSQSTTWQLKASLDWEVSPLSPAILMPFGADTAPLLPRGYLCSPKDH